MEIRFDPRLPLVWRDPHTLQIGVDSPVVVLERLTTRHEAVVSAIAAGHGASGLGPLIHRTGVQDRDVADLVEQLAPALARRPVTTAALVEVAGSCALADATAGLLVDAGVRVRRVDSADAGLDAEATHGVAVSRHVHDPGVAAAWMRRDLPHLAVVVGDRSVRVGPVVVPGRTACARCLDLHRAELDPAWGVIAAQLWGRAPVALPTLAQNEVSARAARRLLTRIAADVGAAEGAKPESASAEGTRSDAERSDRQNDDAVIETVDTETGAVTQTVSRLHRDCGCAALG